MFIGGIEQGLLGGGRIIGEVKEDDVCELRSGVRHEACSCGELTVGVEKGWDGMAARVSRKQWHRPVAECD